MAGFDGMMMKNVWDGLQIKKEKGIKTMSLHVPMVSGGTEKVVFQDVSEFKLPHEYMLVGSCLIRNKEHSFEYRSTFGNNNATIIGFVPKQEA